MAKRRSAPAAEKLASRRRCGIIWPNIPGKAEGNRPAVKACARPRCLAANDQHDQIEMATSATRARPSARERAAELRSATLAANASRITVEDLVSAKKLAGQMGGVSRAQEVLAALARLLLDGHLSFRADSTALAA